MNQIRKDLNLITESLQIDDAYQALPLAVREDLKTIFSEISKLNEAALAPEQIQSVFQSMVTNRGEGGNTAQLAKKAQAQLTPLFAKITGNPKLKAILSKVGSAVPIEGLKKMVAKLPDPAGSNAQAVVASIQKGAQSIENDEDVAAFKGLMLTVITIGMGVAGAGGPAMLAIIGTTAIFRTVVEAGIKAAAGGTVADVAKTAGIGLAKGAIAGLAGGLLGGLGDVEVSGDEQLISASLPTQTIDVTAPLEDAGMSMEEIDQFMANMKADDEIMQQQYFPEFFNDMENDVIDSMDKFNVGPEYAEKYENMMSASATVDGSTISMGVDNFGSSMGVLFNPEEYAEYNAIVAQNGGGTDGLFSEEATAFRKDIASQVSSSATDEINDVMDSYVHPEWKNVLSEEVGEEFDTLVEQVGEAVAVYAMLEWYNSYVKDTQPIIEGMEYLQKYQLIESVEQTMSEAPSLGDMAKKVGGAYKSAVGKAGAVAKKAGGAVVNTIIKPIINSAPVKAFTNKLTALVGAQGAIDPEKLQADYTAAKSPTDSDAVGKFLQQNAGATKDEVDTAFKAAGVQAVAPEEEPEPDAEPAVSQVDANQDGKDDATGAPIPTAQPGDADGAPTSTAQAQVDANQDGKDDATGAPITPTGTSTPGDPKTSAQGNTSSPAGATADGKTPGGAIKQGMDNAEAGDNEIKDGTKKSVNKIPHTWSAEQGEWINAQGVPATGLMKQELMKQVGKDVAGGNEKPGMMQRAKDYVTGKTPGLAQATRSDPKAGILKKAGATAAAGLGGMIGKALGGGQPAPAPGEPAPTPGEPAPAGQAQPEKTPGQFKQAHVPGGKGETQNDPYEVAKQAIRGEQGKDANKKQLPGGKLPPAAGKKVSDMLGQLANGNKDAGAIAGQQILAYAKQGYDVSNAAQVFLAKAKQGERFLKQESYEYFTQMLESFGLGWSDIGITVRIDESVSEGVWLISSDLLRMKDLAGI